MSIWHTRVIREHCLSTENCLVSGLFRSKEVQLTLFGARLGLNRKVSIFISKVRLGLIAYAPPKIQFCK